MLIFEFNQLRPRTGRTGRVHGHQPVLQTPAHFRDVPAIGRGKETGKTYGDYVAESKRFLRALFDVYLEATAGTAVFLPETALPYHGGSLSQRPSGRECSVWRAGSPRRRVTPTSCSPGGVAKLSDAALSFELDDEDIAEARRP
jgi:ribonucleoside-triphosphate reductase